MNMPLVYVHLGTIAPAFVIGTYMMFSRKGDVVHKLLGNIYMGLMLITSAITLFIGSSFGPNLMNHFGLIHILSLVVIFTVPKAYLAARRHDVVGHKISMISLYVGALLIAGAFTLLPGRLMHTWIFG